MTDWLGYGGKKVIVTGCYSGIGKAVANQLVALGAQVHGLDRNPCEQGLASFTQVDLRQPESIGAALDRLTGSFDALFNCAGMPPGAPPLDIMKANFLGMRLLTDGLLQQLNDGAAIVNVSSNGGMDWRSHLDALRDLDAAATFEEGVRWCDAHADLVAEGYRCSKEAIVVWTFASAARNIGRGIRTNCTMPGAVQTPMLVEMKSLYPARL